MRAKRRELPTVELSLAAMVDMMINLLIFLLHLYGGGPVAPTSDDLQLAKSVATEPVHVRVPVVVSRTSIVVGDQRVVELLSDGERTYVPIEAVENGAIGSLTEAIREAVANSEPDTSAELLIQTDRRTTWAVLGPVLRSAANAGVDQYRFVVSSEPPRASP